LILRIVWIYVQDGPEKPEAAEDIQRLVEAALSYIDSTIFNVLGKVATQVKRDHVSQDFIPLLYS
jgi:hypothetical protein